MAKKKKTVIQILSWMKNGSTSLLFNYGWYGRGGDDMYILVYTWSAGVWGVVAVGDVGWGECGAFRVHV